MYIYIYIYVYQYIYIYIYIYIYFSAVAILAQAPSYHGIISPLSCVASLRNVSKMRLKCALKSPQNAS